jgi:FkbM family methyltransferase
MERPSAAESFIHHRCWKESNKKMTGDNLQSAPSLFATAPKEPLLYKAFYLMNILSKRAFPLYRVAYWAYKRISDRELLRIIRNTVKPGMRVLDIGANIGFFTVELSNRVGQNGTVHAFEPEHLNFSRLKQIAGSRKNVILNQCAVAEKSGSINLYISDKMNIDHQTYDSGEGRRQVKINAIALDDYFKNKETVDFFKIDVQGYDYQALKGMMSIIRRSKAVTAIGEFWPYGLKKAGSSPSKYLDLIRGCGLHVSLLSGRTADYWCSKQNDNFSYTCFFAQKSATMTPDCHV